MNRKGFTLVELLATIVVLGIITSITVVQINKNIKNTKDKTEELFVKTLEDGLSMYLDDSNLKRGNFTDTGCFVNKTRWSRDVKLYMINKTFKDVINSEYSPLSQNDLVNPANKKVGCNNGENIPVVIYRDEDYVYYYQVKKISFGCLNNSEGYISNLPSDTLECLE